MAVPNFADKTVWTGDNLDILRGLNSECVDLVYLDPPFNSNQDYSAPVGSEAAGAAFKDTWTLDDLDVAWMGLIADTHPAVANLLHTTSLTHGKGMQSYLTMMAVRLIELHRVLKPTGSIYLHCDATASHYLKLLLDAIFGRRQFRNEITWHYPNKLGTGGSVFDRQHDTLFWYAKRTHTFNVEREAVKRPKPQPVTQKINGQRVWLRDENGKRRYSVSTTKRVGDTWVIPIVNPMAKERVGFPTQKPLALLERIIKASSNEGDIVLDPFAGCATACVAAEMLGRKWVGIDLSPKAVELVNMRLKQSMGSLFHNRLVTVRTDIPRRTDITAPIHYRKNAHVLFGQQEGKCAGCTMDFPFKIFEVDHVIPQARGGTDHIDNLQLLCPSCNRIKGDRGMEYLVSQLKEYSYA